MHNNEPYQRYLDNNTFVIKTNVVNTIFGDKQTHTTKITPEGQLYLYRIYMEGQKKIKKRVDNTDKSVVQ